jgi:hypothetical protein
MKCMCDLGLVALPQSTHTEACAAGKAREFPIPTISADRLGSILRTDTHRRPLFISFQSASINNDHHPHSVPERGQDP